jgi:hypothetical protein
MQLDFRVISATRVGTVYMGTPPPEVSQSRLCTFLVHPKALALTEVVDKVMDDAVVVERAAVDTGIAKEALLEGVIIAEFGRDDEDDTGLSEEKLVESLGGVSKPPKELYCC